MDALADRNLLFGLLALQNGMIDQSSLILAFSTWTRDKVRPLAEVLLDQGAIDEEDRVALSAMAARHLKRNGEDAGESLAAITVARSVRQGLATPADHDLDALIRLVEASSPTMIDVGPEATGTYGAPAGEGRRFRILRPHARGALGEVFVALDEELHREVALKQILDRHADDPSSRTRFVLEAEITGGLEHPGIVPVYGLGRHRDGRPYYAMRFIRGDSLKVAIAAFHSDEGLKKDPGKRSLALRKLLRRFVDVCNAIDYAHGRGVLHRDLKPANVIVGKHGETLVVDWGLAKAMGKSRPGPSSGEQTLMPSPSVGSAETLPGSALGTPSYMSPEQATGDLESLGPRSDVYSLGATLFSVLTGKLPFEGDDLGAILRAVRRGEFPRPRQFDPSIDRALEAVCLKAMSVEPEARYATARALADDVERWAADEPVSAWREPFPLRSGRWMRRNRPAVMAASTAVLVALAGLTGVLAVESRANATLMAKNVELDKANAREASANAGLREANARVQARFDLAHEAIRSFQAGVDEDEMLKGEGLKGLRDKLLRSASGFYEKLERLLQGQADTPSRAILAQSYSELADLTDRIGDKTEALALHRKALSIRLDLAGRPGADAGSGLDVARSLNDVGALADDTGETPAALEALERSRSLVGPAASGPAATDEARTVLADGRQRLGQALAKIGEVARALEVFGEALAIYEKLAERHPADVSFRRRLGETHFRISKLLFYAGRMNDAEGAIRRSLAIREALNAEHPAVTEYRKDLAASLNGLAAVATLSGRWEEALVKIRQVLAIRRALAAEYPAVTEYLRDVASSHLNLGNFLPLPDRAVERLSELEQAVAIWQSLAESNPSVSLYRVLLAASSAYLSDTLRTLGRFDEAIDRANRSVSLLEELIKDRGGAEKANDATEKPSLLLVMNLRRLGLAQAATGDVSGAVATARRTLALCDEISPPSGELWFEMACLHGALASLAGREGSMIPIEGRALESDRAMECFRRAVALQFREPSIKWDVGLDPIRSQAEFQLLMEDLTFPTDPFAR